jgi:hypothetical protein
MVDYALAAPPLSVRVKVVSVDGKAPAADQKFKLAFGSAHEFAGGEWSEWATLASYGGESLFVTECHVEPSMPVEPFPRLLLDIETSVEGGEKRVNQADLFGPKIRLIAWQQEGKTFFDTHGGHIAHVYGPLFKAAEIPADERPKQIAFGDRYNLGYLVDNNLLSWKVGLDGLAGLGINTISSEGSGGLPAIRETMQAAGMKRVWNAVYNPPGGSFNFDPQRREAFDYFVKQQIDPVLAAGWKKSDIAFWVTADEPAWYFPAQYAQFNQNPAALAALHAYLKEQGHTPETFGKKSWDEVTFIGRKDYADLPSRRLFYWTNRFVPLASSRFFADVTKAYEAAIRSGMPVLVNFNNFMGLPYTPGPVGNNPDHGGNAAMGQHDWLEYGRARGGTAISTEDWFGDWAASNWSFHAARLRSAAELSGDPQVGIAGLVIPRESGAPAGMAKKILALVGNGAKTVEFFTWGPEYTFPGNCWSENAAVYKELSAGLRIVGKGEDLLFPGRPKRPEVAILTPQSSPLWDLEEQEVAAGLLDATNTNLIGGRMEYTAEMFAVYHALVRAAVPANFIDEQGLTEETLKDYKVLYLTAPDLPTESLQGVLKWVEAGGVLVTFPGAGHNDRYHQPTDALVVASGIKPEAAVRAVANWNGSNPSGTFEIKGQTLTAYGRREVLQVTDAKAVCAFADGQPAVTWKSLGQGKILHFAFLPGISYFKATAQLSVTNRFHAGAEMRDLLTRPIHYARVNLPVSLSRAVIEAPALYSKQGVAVTLINYGEESQYSAVEDITVTVTVDKPVVRAESATQGPLKFLQQKNHAIITLPFGDVDVVKLYY